MSVWSAAINGNATLLSEEVLVYRNRLSFFSLLLPLPKTRNICCLRFLWFCKIHDHKHFLGVTGCHLLWLYLLGVGLRHFEQLDEAVQQRHADGPQQHLEAGLHQLGQALHQAALTAVHLVVGRHHVRDEGVVGWACLSMTPEDKYIIFDIKCQMKCAAFLHL